MSSKKFFTLPQVAQVSLLALGITLIVISVFCASSVIAILGTAFIFWSVILFYITPVRHVPLPFISAASIGGYDNIERILVEFDLNEKGLYLPPKILMDVESSLVYVPKCSSASLPSWEEINNKLISAQKNGVFLSPPGIGLSQLFEQELGISFTKIDLAGLSSILPKLLIDLFEITDSVNIQVNGDLITIEITYGLFDDVCHTMNNQPRTHSQVGCLLSSALACILAKVTGKTVCILKELRDEENHTTTIVFCSEDKFIEKLGNSY
jgi:hypothetical protein